MNFNSLFYSLVKNSFRLGFTLYNGLRVSGMENIPAEPFIAASNHMSNVDPPLIGGILPTRLRYLAKESLFRNPLLGFFIKTLGAVPVTREDSQRAGAVMKLMLSLLASGESILIFPEGSRSRDGRLKPLEAGVSFLSVKSGAPVLPIYIKGSDRVSPAGSLLPRPVRITVSLSAPIYPDRDIPSEKERRNVLLQALDERLHSMAAEASEVKAGDSRD